MRIFRLYSLHGNRSTSRGRHRLVPYAFLAPTAIALGIGFFIPMLSAIRVSFFRSSLAGNEQFVGLGNYATILGDPRFWNSLIVTTKFTVGVVLGTVIIGLALAIVLNARFKGRAIARSIFMIPWAMPLVPAALIWRWLLDPEFGLMNYLLRQTGLVSSNLSWFQDGSLALVAVIAIEIWRDFPLAMVLYLAGLQGIPPELYEAAKVDGAGARASFLHITLPSIRGQTTVIILLATLIAFGRAFTVTYLLTAGGPVHATEMLTLLTYQTAFQYLEFGQASALGVMVLIIAGSFSVVFLRFARVR